MTAIDDPGWITCDRCGEEVPLTTMGHPWPHKCEG